MEIVTLLLFCAGLMSCILLRCSVLYALATGLVLFLLYGRRKGFSWGALVQMALSGIKAVKKILITFLLIGLLTALWRACGTIPTIICTASVLIHPSIFLLLAFLLNCGVSFLMGTSFGSAATMGVITMTMANAMGINPLLVGGAILSGVYFGDRCSPVSTSALLVSELTKTDIFQNIRLMCGSALLPFLLTCILYLILGISASAPDSIPNIRALFSRQFSLHWLTLTPAAVILLLSAFHIPVIKTMLFSILTALICCAVFQKTPVDQLAGWLILGYQSPDPQLAVMMNGGGILSMARTAAIVCISSTYSGIFDGTRLLDGIKGVVSGLGNRIGAFGATACTAILSGIFACNQTLTIILTHQLCHELETDQQKLAIYLEDSAVVIAPMIPWSIAGAVPLSTVGAPISSIFFAFFLYILPVSRFAEQILRRLFCFRRKSS